MISRVPLAPTLGLVIGVVMTWIYAWVLDDAFIYFRYADNASVLGAGLVYNLGEYVEGFTSPLWMLLLVAARALHFRYWPFLLAIGVLSMSATWALAIRVNRRLSGKDRVEFHLPALWITTCYAVESHFTSGLETPLVQVFALAFVALILEPQVKWLQLAVALGPLVRPELELAFVIAVAWCWYREKRVPWRLLGVGILAQAAWLAFRLYYYADVVPNTFHLKDTSATSRGLHYIHDTLRAHYLYWLLGGLFVLFGVAVWKRRGQALHLAPRAVLWITAAAHAAYVARIGGDFVHYRYLAFPVLVFVASLGGVVEQFLGPTDRVRQWAAFGLGVAFMALMLSAYPEAQLPTHPLSLPTEGDSLAMYRVDGVEDASSHRLRLDLAPSSWDKSTSEVEKFLRNGKLVYHWAAASGWCREGYERLDWFVVQSFGLTDPVLPHVIDPAPSFQAGHRWGVAPLAHDLVAVRFKAFGPAGMDAAALPDDRESVYQAASERREVPPWIFRNRRALSAIERRTHRPRALWADLNQATFMWPKIEVNQFDIVKALRPD